MINHLPLLMEELTACGLSVLGVDSHGIVQFINEDTSGIAPLVIDAHDKALDSPECLALQSAIPEASWGAYLLARNSLIRSQRQERYQNESDPLFLRCFEEAETQVDGSFCVVRLPVAVFEEWKTLKENIRQSLPYKE